jgi:hypothetical protein
MNAQEKAKQQAEVMLAFANGAEIEYTVGKDCQGWIDNKTPAWDWNTYSYRVKVVPKVVNYYCYESGTGELRWVVQNGTINSTWSRIPELDKMATYD